MSISGTKKRGLAFVELMADEPEGLAAFYCDVLGMSVRDQGAGFVRVGYGGGDADVLLRQGIAGVQSRADRYWKIGITLPNVDMAVAQLKRRGVVVSVPKQFQDIGYMAHLADPAGYQIELLQHDFEANRTAGAGDSDAPLGGGARIGQITLRTNDVESSLGVWRDQLGMKLLSVQPVVGFGFTLYFLGFTEDVPPGHGLEDVAHREWLWKRPYTTLELQHVAGPLSDSSGYVGVGLSGVAPVLDDFGHHTLEDI
ncbi:VOC family protein [Amylibacter sp. IMCC11727]|uniref:VOC family protein n=1 Tax=Amylibacter sp. IMCC11727 TaxID=3039851 RepID=UPI00244D9DD9|nr:VOC family protein [Amylibacter sp. IMCC11727]WGI22720.1 VOC family protein [Amylibacter sp. IMCC11727]